MFGFSFFEIIILVILGIVLFGDKNLPLHIKKFLTGVNQAKKIGRNLQNSWYEIQNDVQESLEIKPEKFILSQEDLDEKFQEEQRQFQKEHL